MALARSKRTYTIGWDGCGSLPFRNGRRITAGLDRHFKTNHRLAYPSCPHRIDRSPRQLHYCIDINLFKRMTHGARLSNLGSCCILCIYMKHTKVCV